MTYIQLHSLLLRTRSGLPVFLVLKITTLHFLSLANVSVGFNLGFLCLGLYYCWGPWKMEMVLGQVYEFVTSSWRLSRDPLWCRVVVAFQWHQFSRDPCSCISLLTLSRQLFHAKRHQLFAGMLLCTPFANSLFSHIWTYTRLNTSWVSHQTAKSIIHAQSDLVSLFSSYLGCLVSCVSNQSRRLHYCNWQLVLS